MEHHDKILKHSHLWTLKSEGKSYPEIATISKLAVSGLGNRMRWYKRHKDDPFIPELKDFKQETAADLIQVFGRDMNTLRKNLIAKYAYDPAAPIRSANRIPNRDTRKIMKALGLVLFQVGRGKLWYVHWKHLNEP